MKRLADVVDFEALLARDQAQAARDGSRALAIRDRALMANHLELSDAQRLEAWTEARRQTEDNLPGERALGLVSLVGWLLLAVGLAAGAGTGTALLAYDGKSPINVLAWLLYTAALPFALGVVLVLGLLLPARWFSRAGAAQALIGAIVQPLLRRLPDGARWVRRLFGGDRGRRLQRWLLVALTQIFTLGFVLAVGITLLVKVTITDLTFSWSTSLQLNDSQVTKAVEIIAAPWAWLYPDAVPDAEAVAASNYRRFIDRFRGTDARTAVDLAIGAKWWKLCAAAVLFYGLLPRILLLLLSAWRWQAALSGWPDPERPEVQALLDRFDDRGGLFARRSTEPEPEAEVEPEPKPEPEPVAAYAAAYTLCVAWGEAAREPETVAEAIGAPAEATRAGAGFELDLDAEAAVLEQAATLGGSVLVAMPAGEPPIEDVLAFLRELRTVTPSVHVTSVDQTDAGWQRVPFGPGWQSALRKVEGVEVAP